MKPFTEPSAYRDTMSPMWRKLDLCSGIFTEDMFHTRSCFSIYEQIHTLQRLQFGISHQIRRHSSRSAVRQSRSSKVKAQEGKTSRRLWEKRCVFALNQLLPVCQRDPQSSHPLFRGRRLPLSRLWANSVQWQVFWFLLRAGALKTQVIKWRFTRKCTCISVRKDTCKHVS